jgi:hypothetical protein
MGRPLTASATQITDDDHGFKIDLTPHRNGNLVTKKISREAF